MRWKALNVVAFLVPCSFYLLIPITSVDHVWSKGGWTDVLFPFQRYLDGQWHKSLVTGSYLNLNLQKWGKIAHIHHLQSKMRNLRTPLHIPKRFHENIDKHDHKGGPIVTHSWRYTSLLIAWVHESNFIFWLLILIFGIINMWPYIRLLAIC